MKHTKGPWVLLSPKRRKKPSEFEHNQTVMVQGRGNSYFTIATVTGPSNLDHLSEWEANARLIAAAPMLLSELKDIELALKNGGLKRPKQWLESISATIAKAEGR